MFEQPIEESAAMTAPRVRKLRILVVDDARFVRELLGIHLRTAGYEVVLAEDGIEAGHKVLHSSPDLILCDLQMPYMDGLEFLSAMKADASIPRIPVVFLSSREDGRDAALGLGAAAFLVKPIRIDELLETIAKHLGGG